MTSRIKNRKGFTLIELLVVISILGMLASMTLVSLSTVRAKSRDLRRKNDMETLRRALDMYHDANFEYPTTSGAWRSSCTGTGNACSGNLTTGFTNGWIPSNIGTTPLVPNAIASLPVDPKNGASSVFSYYYRSNGVDYKLFITQMETDEGRRWAVNDGGRNNSTYGRNYCGIDNQAPESCAAYNPADPTTLTTLCKCHYEIFTPGGQVW